MRSFSELQESVRRRIVDVTDGIEAEIPSLVNAAIQDAQRRNNFNAMRASRDYLLSDGQAGVARPERIKQLRGAPIVAYDTDTNYEMRVLDFNEFTTQETGIYNPGPPRYLIITDGDRAAEWIVHPTPDGQGRFTDDAYRVRIFFWRYFAPLTGAADTNWLTDNADEYIIAEATARAFLMNWEEERAAVSRQEADRKLATVVKEDRRAIASGTATMVPIGGVFSSNGPEALYGGYWGRWSGRAN